MFSVVIPLYNKSAWIGETIGTVLNQTYLPSEIIVVDDGSTDQSLELIREIDHPLIKIMSTSRSQSGPSAARNLGAREATNDWIAFLDADDLWDPSYLQRIRHAISSSSVVPVCVFSAWYTKVNGQVIPSKLSKRLPEKLEVNFEEFIELWTNERACPMWTSAVVVQRGPFLATGGFPEEFRRGEDKVAWFRIAQQGISIYNPAPSAIYNLDVVGQSTSNYSNDRHPLCIEIAHALSKGNTRKLRKLYNLQIIRYALDIRLKERLKRDLIKGFFIRENPAWFIILRILHLSPSIILKSFRIFLDSSNLLWPKKA